MADAVALQHGNEEVLAQRRKHWINLLPIIFVSVLLILILIGFIFFYGSHTAQVEKYLPASVLSLGVMIYLAIVAFIGLLGIWVWRQNRLVLTNHHIMQFTRRGVFDHTISQFSLIKLQDVTAKQRGLLPNMLGYGDVVIETAGEEENFVFSQVPNPQELANQIMEAHEKLESAVERDNRSV